MQPFSRHHASSDSEYSSHLEPCDDYIPEYRARVEELIASSQEGELVLAVNVYPSFAAEWGIRVVVRGDEYYLSALAFDGSLWGSSWVEIEPGQMVMDMNKAHVRVREDAVPISATLSSHLLEEWSRSLSDARAVDVFGLDGVTY